jgi:hypothetical protein
MNALILDISPGVKAPFLTSSVTVFQLRIMAICVPGLDTPSSRNASIAVATDRKSVV